MRRKFFESAVARLSYSGNREVTLKELAELLEVKQVSALMLMDLLEQKGLAEKTTNRMVRRNQKWRLRIAECC